MSGARQTSIALCTALLAVAVSGCEEEPTPSEPKSAPSAPVATAVPTPSAVKPPPPPKPREDCPEGSSGIGSFDKPCTATGASRMMEATWTGKITDKGPTFRVVSNSELVILYGSIAVYFYDKKGKQLDVTTADKTRPMQLCSGKIFAGVMKPEEKAVLTFSCVKKSHVPEGTEAIEAELRMVGFADESGKRTEFYWKNEDLTPKDRPKGGLKEKKKGKKRGKKK